MTSTGAAAPTDTGRAQPLSARYRGLVCDLDGVIYRGHLPLEHAIKAITQARRSGTRVVYATNNASRPPRDVAGQLRELGLQLEDSDVVTSSQAGAARLRDLLAPGSAVLAVGGPGVAQALREVGLSPVRAEGTREDGASDDGSRVLGAGEDGGVAAVLQGYGADVGWRDLAAAAYAVQAGALWVATNTDSTLPTARGKAPGNGALVDAVRRAVDVDPIVVGKPCTPLYDLSAAVLGTPAAQTLAVGDRLNTDIEGANAAGMDSLLVLTGVDGVGDVAVARKRSRPRYLATDLRALAVPYLEVDADGRGGWRCGGAVATAGPDGFPALADGGAPDERLRVAVAAAWAGADEGRDLSQLPAQRWDDLRRQIGRGQAAATAAWQ